MKYFIKSIILALLLITVSAAFAGSHDLRPIQSRTLIVHVINHTGETIYTQPITDWSSNAGYIKLLPSPIADGESANIIVENKSTKASPNFQFEYRFWSYFEASQQVYLFGNREIKTNFDSPIDIYTSDYSYHPRWNATLSDNVWDGKSDKKVELTLAHK